MLDKVVFFFVGVTVGRVVIASGFGGKLNNTPPLLYDGRLSCAFKKGL